MNRTPSSTIDSPAPVPEETIEPSAPQPGPSGTVTPNSVAAHTAEPAQAVPVPADQDGIDRFRVEIDAIDAELVRLIQRRTALSNAIGEARRGLGGPRIVYSREMAILERFRALGPAGTDLGMLLLSMGRGRMGRK